jgi:hypothetical protein
MLPTLVVAMLSPPRGIPRPVIPLVKVIVKWGA